MAALVKLCFIAALVVNLNTEAAWSGHLYVKEHFADTDCRVTGDGQGQLAAINLGFSQCNVKRFRSLEPRGVSVETTLVLSFHPIFLTKVDRAYRIRCFYMEADKTVSSPLEVSGITTGFATFNVPMPTCVYEIRDGPDFEQSNPVQFALLGQSVYHHWVCDTDVDDVFCMVVYDCKVSDAAGTRTLQLVNENGCAVDKHLLDNLEYSADLRAVKESHVFKFADMPSLEFNCQIDIMIKDPGSQCARPQCAPLLRSKRDVNANATELSTPKWKKSTDDNVGTIDVAIKHPMLVGDIELKDKDIPAVLKPTHNVQQQEKQFHQTAKQLFKERGHSIDCPRSQQIIIVAAVVFSISSLGFIGLLAVVYGWKRTKKQDM